MAAVVLLIVLVVGGDRLAQSFAENRIATQIQTELKTAEKPAVDLGQFPFLNELVTGRFPTARVQLEQVELPDTGGATASEVDTTFHDITASDRYSRVVAAHAETTALLPYASLSALTRLDLSYAEGDRVQIRFEVPVAGATVSGTASGRPSLDVEKQTLEFTDAKLSLGSTALPQSVVDAVGRLVLGPLPLDSLPYDLTLTSLAVEPDGVRVTATGSNVPLRG